MNIDILAKQGKTTEYGSMVESVATRLYDLRKKAIKDRFQDFQNNEHRLEFVAKIRGVEYINDSMACNINSTWYALENIKKPIIWIVGGQTKDTDFKALYNLVKNKVKVIICMGIDNEPIKTVYSSIGLSIIETASAFSAVESSYLVAQEGDAVLLSPACPSFDLFESYEDRGVQFKNAVNEL
ncbi:MAG: hypothetical protein RRX93_00250 [Bacteroidales bacterium]